MTDSQQTKFNFDTKYKSFPDFLIMNSVSSKWSYFYNFSTDGLQNVNPIPPTKPSQTDKINQAHEYYEYIQVVVPLLLDLFYQATKKASCL